MEKKVDNKTWFKTDFTVTWETVITVVAVLFVVFTFYTNSSADHDYMESVVKPHISNYEKDVEKIVDKTLEQKLELIKYQINEMKRIQMNLEDVYNDMQKKVKKN